MFTFCELPNFINIMQYPRYFTSLKNKVTKLVLQQLLDTTLIYAL